MLTKSHQYYALSPLPRCMASSSGGRFPGLTLALWHAVRHASGGAAPGSPGLPPALYLSLHSNAICSTLTGSFGSWPVEFCDMPLTADFRPFQAGLPLAAPCGRERLHAALGGYRGHALRAVPGHPAGFCPAPGAIGAAIWTTFLLVMNSPDGGSCLLLYGAFRLRSLSTSSRGLPRLPPVR